MLFKKIIDKRLLVPAVCLLYVVLSQVLVSFIFSYELLIFLLLLMLDFFVFLLVPHMLLWYADKIKKLDAPEVNGSLGEMFSQFLLTTLLARLVCLIQVAIYSSGVGELKVIILLSFSVILIGTRLFVLYYSEKNIKLVISNLILFIIVIFYHQFGV
ncbi:hypothetical protein KKC17_03790 [Patescibacteria group bacterium]|nr:hypothetical protein [Patescibacteria group bacterium]